MPNTLRTYAEDFLSLFYPNTCIACGNLLPRNRKDICPTCLYNLPKTKNHIIPVPQFTDKFEGIVKVKKVLVYSYFVKHGIIQHVLHDLKYGDNREIGRMFGKYYGSDLKTEADLAYLDEIVPVPLHPKKLALRGYNQSELIAEGLSAALGIPLNIETLVRLKHQSSMTKRSKVDRINTMKSTYGTTNRIDITNKHILLVDDVLTTGATLIACTEALHKLSPKSISIAVLAGVK